MFNGRHLTHLKKLAEKKAVMHAAWSIYSEKIQDLCDHPLIFEHSYGYEDTLGNYSREGTDQWNCACCAKFLGSQPGNDRRPAEYRGRIVHIPGSITMRRKGRRTVREEVLTTTPQTEAQVREQLDRIAIGDVSGWSIF